MLPDVNEFFGLDAMKKSIAMTIAAMAAGPAFADADATYGGTFRDPGVTSGDGTKVTIELVSSSELVYCVEFPEQSRPNCFDNARIPFTGSSDGTFTFSAPNFGKWEFERVSPDQIDVTFTYVSGRVSFAELRRGVVYSEIPN